MAVVGCGRVSVVLLTFAAWICLYFSAVVPVCIIIALGFLFLFCGKFIAVCLMLDIFWIMDGAGC